MSWKKINFFFPLLGIVLAFSSIIILTWGCLPADPTRTKIVDSKGNIIYMPPEDPTQTGRLPSTGRDSLDYVVATAFAAAYGAFGYWIRRVKINGAEQLLDLKNRVGNLERTEPLEEVPTNHPLTVNELRRLAELLDQIPGRSTSTPPIVTDSPGPKT